MCCKPKYRVNIFHHFIFVFFLYFSYHSSCRKDQFTVVILKFGTQDFTDPGLLNIRQTLTSLSLWFCLHKCFLRKIWNHRPADLMSSVLLSTIHLNVKSCTKKIFPYCAICYTVQCKFADHVLKSLQHEVFTLCSLYSVMHLTFRLTSDCASSLSWCGNFKSTPPVWMSIELPNIALQQKLKKQKIK